MRDKKEIVLSNINNLWVSYLGRMIIIKDKVVGDNLSFTVDKNGIVSGKFSNINSSDNTVEDYLTALCHELGHMIYNKFVDGINIPKLHLTKREKFKRLILELTCDIFAVRIVTSVLGLKYSPEFVKIDSDYNKSYFNLGYPTVNERLLFMSKACITSSDIISLGMKYIPKEMNSYFKGDKDSIVFIDTIIRDFC